MDKLDIDQGSELILEKIPSFLKKKYDLSKVDFKVVKWIPILHQAWELDEWAVAINVTGVGLILLDTDHGSLYQVENPKEFLEDHRSRYKLAASAASSAMELF